MIYIKSLNKQMNENDKNMIALIYRLAVWTRCDSKEFPELSSVLRELDGEQSEQAQPDMAATLKKFASRSKKAVKHGEKKKNRQ